MVLVLLFVTTVHHIICLNIILHLDGNMLVHHLLALMQWHILKQIWNIIPQKTQVLLYI